LESTVNPNSDIEEFRLSEIAAPVSSRCQSRPDD